MAARIDLDRDDVHIASAGKALDDPGRAVANTRTDLQHPTIPPDPAREHGEEAADVRLAGLLETSASRAGTGSTHEIADAHEQIVPYVIGRIRDGIMHLMCRTACDGGESRSPGNGALPTAGAP